MDAIERELSRTIRLLLKLGSYSESNAITIQHILERYHTCVDKLCAYDNVLFLNSVLIIALLEPKLKLLLSKDKPFMLRMQNFYETKKELQSSLMMDLKLYTMYIVKSKHAL